MGDHTTSDDAQRYRTGQELQEWAVRDPIDRLRKYMKKNELWNDEYEGKVRSDAAEKVQLSVERFESVSPPSAKDLFAWTFAEWTPNLKRQYDDLARSLGEAN
jgi:pyruvate dehydrogenase E1 component alpha subunit